MSEPLTRAEAERRIAEIEREFKWNPPSTCGWGPDCPYCTATAAELDTLRATLKTLESNR